MKPTLFPDDISLEDLQMEQHQSFTKEESRKYPPTLHKWSAEKQTDEPIKNDLPMLVVCWTLMFFGALFLIEWGFKGVMWLVGKNIID